MSDEPLTLLHELGQKIAADAMVQSVVSNRVFIGTAPAGTPKPYIAIYQVFTEPYHDLQGEIGKSKSTVQIDCWDDGVDAVLHVKRVSNALRALFTGFRGALVPGGAECDSVICTRTDVTGTKRMDGSETVDYRASLDFAIIHEDSLGG